MNISYNWLKNYIKTDKSADELAKILTASGLEVGTVENVQSIKGGLEGLVIGEVMTCEMHENSDHLHVTTVNVGQEELLQIVCGAHNVAKGQKVVVATVGTTLYDGEDSFKIKKSKLRGVASFGMICAEDEIGVGSGHDGIMELPLDTPVGTLAKDYFNVDEDAIIEVDITPNRADGISHYGVARDLAAYFKAHQIEYKLVSPSVDQFKVDNTDSNINVIVEDEERCPRYAGVSISNIKVEESPEWLRTKLNTIGIRPINNIVDITNYVLHAFGQPLHAFDAAQIKGNEIHVKTCAEGTKFTTLDEVERTLTTNDLMICNAKEPMCIAGVFGGLESGVTEKTTSIFLESAYFNPISVRKTARRNGLNTDASFRFERGIDPNNTLYALKYAALLIQEIAGGTISSEISDNYPNPIEDFTVNITLKKIHTLIGKEIPVDMIERIFEGLEMQILSKDQLGYSLQVPAYRVDVQRDVDVIEDILRIYGYNNIELSERLVSNLSYGLKPDSHKLQNIISEQLTATGFNEIMNNSLTKSSYYENSQTYPEQNCVHIMNALSNDLNVMRQTMLFGGLESISHNANRQNANLKFYEFGNCYQYNEANKQEDDLLKAYTDSFRLGMWITGNKNAQSWTQEETVTSFFEMKAYVLNILSRLGVNIEKVKQIEIENEFYTQALEIQTGGNKVLATIGIVDAKLLKSFSISNPVYYAELDWKLLLKQNAKFKVNFTEISKFPAVKRDLALLVDTSVSFAQIEELAYKTERKLLQKVNLFDVYEGNNLPAGKKSYAVNFTIQDTEKTLKDKQIDNIMQKMIKTFTEKLGAQLR